MLLFRDDHEIQDDSYTQGAEDFDGPPSQFQHLKRGALQAYLEWVPIRGASPTNPAGAQRSFHLGDLATLILAENRVAYRNKPIDMPDTTFYKEVAKKSISEWDDDVIYDAREELRDQLRDPDRVMLGEPQLERIAAAVKESVAGGRPWQLFVSQTVLSQIKAPRLLETLPLQPRILRWICRGALRVATSEKIAGEACEQARMYIGMGRYNVEMNPSAWDGYQAERQRLLRALDVPGSNPIILAGDSHNAWCHEVLDDTGKKVAVVRTLACFPLVFYPMQGCTSVRSPGLSCVLLFFLRLAKLLRRWCFVQEFDGPAVTSIGAFEDIHGQFQAKGGALVKAWPLFIFSPWIEDSFLSANPDTLKYCNLTVSDAVLNMASSYPVPFDL